MPSEQEAIKPLLALPGVGPSIARDLLQLGISRPELLRGRNPEVLYERLCELQRVKVDRCMLYVFRCIVHHVTHPHDDPELDLWWNWKDDGPALAAPAAGKGGRKKKVQKRSGN